MRKTIKIFKKKKFMALLFSMFIAFSIVFALKNERRGEIFSVASLEENEEYEIISLFGKKLYPLPPDKTSIENYEKAKLEFENNPNEKNYIWLGRRTAYLMKYKKAIEIYTEGLIRYPSSYRLLRHRGHRYITIREFEKAISDLKKAAELIQGKPLEKEEDGIPNKANIPLSNTQFNIWYHLGLAYYLSEDYINAIQAYKECLKWCDNDDLLVATLDWLYMTYRRIGEVNEAQKLLTPIHEKMKIIENQAYHRRLLMYKGLIKPETLILIPENESEYEKSLTFSVHAYGLGNWYYYQGEESKAREIFELLLKEKNWATFGYIAAEVDLYSIQKKES